MVPCVVSQSSFPADSEIEVVVACTFDPFGISAPLQVWLERLAGFRIRLRWVGYGLHSILSALTSAQSEWVANARGVNLLFARDIDLQRASDDALSAAQLAQALADSASMRTGCTVVLLPPTQPADAMVAADAPALGLHAELLAAATGCRVSIVGEAALAAQLSVLGSHTEYYSSFSDRVAHAPYPPEAASALAGAAAREVARAVAPPRKVLALDADNTLWGGAVGELGAAGVAMSAPFLAAQRFFVAAQRRGLLLCLVSRNEEADVRAVLAEREGEMALRLEDLVAIKANWQRKSANLRALAADLCLDNSTAQHSTA
jgi:hypothetical protein